MRSLHDSLQAPPIKVCVHEKSKVERDFADLREHQIQAICKEYVDLQARYHALEDARTLQCSEWASQEQSFHAELLSLQKQNQQQCFRITELTTINTELQAALVEAKAMVSQLQTKCEHQEQQAKEAEHLQYVATEFRKKYQQLQQLHQDLKEEHSALKHDAGIAKEDLAKQVKHNRHLVKSSNLAHDQLQGKDRALATAEAERRAALAERDAVLKKLTALTKALENRDRALQQRRGREVQRVERTLQEERAECERLQQERARLRREAAEHCEALEETLRLNADQNARLLEATAETQRLSSLLAQRPPPAAAYATRMGGGHSSPWGFPEGAPTLSSVQSSPHRPPSQMDPLDLRVRFAETAAEPPAARARPPLPPQLVQCRQCGTILEWG